MSIALNYSQTGPAEVVAESVAASDLDRAIGLLCSADQLRAEAASLLGPTAAEIVANALESPPDPASTLPEPRTLSQRRADALVDLCHNIDNNNSGTRATVDVIVDIETLAGVNDAFTVKRLRRELGLRRFARRSHQPTRAPPD